MRRALRWAGLIALLCVSPAAANDDVQADFVAVVSSNGPGTADILAVCTGQATRTTASVSVTCSIESTAGVTSMTCDSPLSRGVCTARVTAAPLPVTVCSDATAHLRDGGTATDRDCVTYLSVG